MPRPGRYWPDTRNNALPRPPHWSQGAVCRQVDPDLFYPEGERGATAFLIEEAKGYCRTCPVMHECLEDALERGEPHGVWGGLDENERRALRRRAAEKRAAEDAARTTVPLPVVEDEADARAPAA